MGCEYCGAVCANEHPAACPNAPYWEPPKQYCTECGTELDERADKPFHGLCMECFCKMYEQQAAVDFVRADEERLTDFLEYLYQDVQYRKFEYRGVINETLFRLFLNELSHDLEVTQENTRGVLKEYCLAPEAIEYFAEFMYDEGWL